MGLEGVRKKLDDEGDRIQHDVGEYGTFSQSIIELTKIVSLEAFCCARLLLCY